MIYSTFVEARGAFRDQIDFLARAITTDPKRLSIMGFIHIDPIESGEGFRAVTTDGRRLHIVEKLSCFDGLGIEAGEWKFLRVTPNTAWIAKIIDGDIGKFPNYRKITEFCEKGEPEFRTDFSGYSKRSWRGANFVRLIEFVNSFPEPTVISPDHLVDLGLDDWEVEYWEKNKMVRFTSGLKKAIIMPVQYDGPNTTGGKNEN